MSAFDLTDMANFAAHKLYRDELGRVPSITEHGNLARFIRDNSFHQAFNNLYGSAEAAAYRKRVGRTV